MRNKETKVGETQTDRQTADKRLSCRRQRQRHTDKDKGRETDTEREGDREKQTKRNTGGQTYTETES